MALMVKKKKAEKVKPKIRWWKLKETSCQEVFRQEVTRILGGKDGLPDEWNKTAEMLRKTAETVLGVTFGLVIVPFQPMLLHLSWLEMGNTRLLIASHLDLSFKKCLTFGGPQHQTQ